MIGFNIWGLNLATVHLVNKIYRTRNKNTLHKHLLQWDNIVFFNLKDLCVVF